MDCHHLIVLKCEVVTCSLEVSDLHEVTRKQGLANVWVVVRISHGLPTQFQPHFDHDLQQLFADVVCLFEGSEVEKVVVAPIRVFLLELEGIEHIEQTQMVPVFVGKSALSRICFVLAVLWPKEDNGHVKQSYDGNTFVYALQSLSSQEYLGHLGVQREFTHFCAKVSELPFI